MNQRMHFQVIFWGLENVLIQHEQHQTNPITNRDQLALLRQSALSFGQETLCWAIASQERLNESMLSFARSLRGELRTVLVANARRQVRLELERRWRIAVEFDDLLLSAECGLALPDVRFFRTALRRANALPGQAILVDACQENVRVARALGIFGIWHRSNDDTLVRVSELLAKPAGMLAAANDILDNACIQEEFVLA